MNCGSVIGRSFGPLILSDQPRILQPLRAAGEFDRHGDAPGMKKPAMAAGWKEARRGYLPCNG